MRIFVIGLCMIILLTDCKTEDGYKKNENLPQLKAELEREYVGWKSFNIQNYQFIIHISNLGSYTKITVKNGIFQNAIDVYSNESEEPFYKTIDAVFESIREDFFIEENNSYFSPGRIGTTFSVCYDSQYHYPKEYTLTAIYNQSYGCGNSRTISITDFTLLDK